MKLTGRSHWIMIGRNRRYLKLIWLEGIYSYPLWYYLCISCGHIIIITSDLVLSNRFLGHAAVISNVQFQYTFYCLVYSTFSRKLPLFSWIQQGLTENKSTSLRLMSWCCQTVSHYLNIFRVTGHLCGEFPAEGPVTRSYDVFFDLRLNKRLSKQSWGWWFKTLPRPL